MKRRIMSILLSLCLLMGMMVFPATEASAEVYTAGMNHGVLLYTGYNGYSGTKFNVPTDDALEILLNTTDEILLNPIITYNCYTDSDGVVHQIVTEDIINNMTSDMINYPSYLSSVKTQYLDAAARVISANYNMDDYVADTVAMAKRLVAINPDVKLWFSVTSCEGLHALTHLYAPAWVDMVSDMKEAVGEDIWNHNVMGIYYSGEDIITYQYTKFDTTAMQNDYNSPIVYAMHQVSDAVHAYGKQMLWIPYYHPGTPGANNLGYVVNQTNIFDTVILQPSYYFNSSCESGLSVIYNCVKQQSIVTASGSVIGGSKTSDTVIGFEMEISDSYFTDSEYRARYQQYVSTFAEFVGKYPTAFYADNPDVMITLTPVISQFFMGEADYIYAVPTDDIDAWYAERTSNHASGYSWFAPLTGSNASDEIEATVGADGSIRLNLSGTFGWPVARVQNNSGLVTVSASDYLNVDACLEGKADDDIFWNLQMYIDGVQVDFSPYLAAAAGSKVNSSGWMTSGDYRVSVNLGEVLKAYDADNGTSTYTTAFGRSGTETATITQIWFCLYSSDPANNADKGLTLNSVTFDDVPASAVKTVPVACYSLPVDSMDLWKTWESDTALANSQLMVPEITDEGLSLRFNENAYSQSTNAFVSNSGGLAKMFEGDKLKLDIVVEGNSGGTDLRWNVNLYLAGTGEFMNISKYIGEAAGLPANAYGQLPQGTYQVELDLAQLLKDYDADKGLTGSNSTYQKVLGVGSNNYLVGVYFSLITNDPGTTDQGRAMLIREVSVTRGLEVYETPAYADIATGREDGAPLMTIYTLPVDDISAWVAERTAASAAGEAWSAPLTGENKSDIINGTVTNSGAMRLTLSGRMETPIARVQNHGGLVTVSDTDYLNLDVYLEGDDTDVVRWGLSVYFGDYRVDISRYVAEAAGDTVNAYNQMGAGTYRVSLNIAAAIRAYDADHGTSYYDKIFGSDGEAVITQFWFHMYSNTPASYTNTGLIINSCTVTHQATFENHVHRHSAAVTDPTCTEQGYTTYTCTCGDGYVADYVDATGHSYGEWYSSAVGEERRDCENCSHYETRTVEVPGPAITTQPADVTVYAGQTAGFSVEAEGEGLTYQWYIMRSGEETFTVWNNKTTAAVSFKTAESNNGMQVYCVVTDTNGGSTTSAIAKLTLETVPFDDVTVESDFFEPIMWAYENGITTGSDGSFNGNDICTRRQVVLFLYRYAGEPGHSVTENPFVDVSETSIYYDAIMWAYEKGITIGTDPTHFSPGETVTRGQFVMFLWRLNGSPEPVSAESPFVDVSPTSDFYKPILWAYENGITTGKDATHFSRSEGCTRKQVVAFLYRALNET